MKNLKIKRSTIDIKVGDIIFYVGEEYQRPYTNSSFYHNFGVIIKLSECFDSRIVWKSFNTGKIWHSSFGELVVF